MTTHTLDVTTGLESIDGNDILYCSGMLSYDDLSFEDMVLVMDVLVVVFFFFQAEDGIRDYKVTGVQTCALPILFLSRRSSAFLLGLRCVGEGFRRRPMPCVSSAPIFEAGRSRDSVPACAS